MQKKAKRVLDYNRGNSLSSGRQGSGSQHSDTVLENPSKERISELFNSFKLLERVVSGFDVHLACLDTSFNFISVNRAYALAHKQSPEFFIGKNYFAVHPEFPEARIIFTRVMQTGEPYTSYESPLASAANPETGPDRSQKYFDWSVQPLKDADGPIDSMMLSLIDVTARRKAEQDRRKLAAAVESTTDAVAIIDRSWNVRYVNPAFERITGYSKKELIGQNLPILIGDVQNAGLIKSIGELLKSGKSWSGRLNSKKKDGTLFEEEMSISPIQDPADSTSYVVVKRDITEKVRLESIAQAVDTINNIGYIFMGVRHEIGNPINILYMILDVLKAKLDRLDRPEIENYLDRALREVSKVGYLLQTLRNFNMYEKPKVRRVSMPEFMDGFRSLVEQDFQSKKIHFTITIDPHTPNCLADPGPLQQVLLSVLANASDAVREHSDARISVTVSEKGGMVKLHITDNGCGMGEEQQKDLFKPFYTTKPGGTGLGLVIAKKILTLMNATIAVRSRKGIGTVVDIALPQSIDEDGKNKVMREVILHGKPS